MDDRLYVEGTAKQLPSMKSILIYSDKAVELLKDSQ